MLKKIKLVRKYSSFLTIKKFYNLGLNYLSYKLSYVLKMPIVFGMPSTALVEPTNICNLKCPLCPCGNGTLSREKGHMNLSTFKRFLNQAAPNLLSISFWNYGEPLLNKSVFDMIRCAHERKIYTIISTNGHYFSEENIENILDCGLTKVILSIDGVSNETLSRYRVGAKLGTIAEGVKSLAKRKKEGGHKVPLIVFQFIVMKHNEHELEQAHILANELGCDEFAAEYVHGDSESLQDYLPSDENRRAYDKRGRLKKKFGYVCRRPWEHCVINWNGDVAACCHDPNNTIMLGNINSTSFKEIWFGERYRNLRKQLATGELPEVCQSCPYY